MQKRQEVSYGHVEEENTTPKESRYLLDILMVKNKLKEMISSDPDPKDPSSSDDDY